MTLVLLRKHCVDRDDSLAAVSPAKVVQPCRFEPHEVRGIIVNQCVATRPKLTSASRSHLAVQVSNLHQAESIHRVTGGSQQANGLEKPLVRQSGNGRAKQA